MLHNQLFFLRALLVLARIRGSSQWRSLVMMCGRIVVERIGARPLAPPLQPQAASADVDARNGLSGLSSSRHGDQLRAGGVDEPTLARRHLNTHRADCSNRRPL